MKSINKATLQGTLGRDAEVRRNQSGNRFINLSVATEERWKDKATGDWKGKTEWHRVSVAFAAPETEDLAERLRKGNKVYIEGKIETKKFQNKAGVDQYSTQIVVGKYGVLRMADGEAAPAAGGFDRSDLDDEIPF